MQQEDLDILREFKTKEGLSQSQLAEKANVSQSTVSRTLLGAAQRHGAARKKLFTYVKNESKGNRTETGAGLVLKAFEEIWDGSDNHAAAVARVIDAMDGLKPETIGRE